MIEIPIQLSPELAKRANSYSIFRENCKKYLADNGYLYDKFTTTDNDSFLGYVSEELFANYLKDKYQGKVSVTRWQDQFDMRRVLSIVKNGSNNKNDIELIRDYFYDSFDLYVSAPNFHAFISLKIDVKTAITSKMPQTNWEFLYPIVQAKKEGKDIAVLVYYIVNTDGDRNSLNKLVIIGYLKEEDICGCEIIHAGERTKHHTLSQTENYITYVRDYHDINELFKEIESL